MVLGVADEAGQKKPLTFPGRLKGPPVVGHLAASNLSEMERSISAGINKEIHHGKEEVILRQDESGITFGEMFRTMMRCETRVKFYSHSWNGESDETETRPIDPFQNLHIRIGPLFIRTCTDQRMVRIRAVQCPKNSISMIEQRVNL